MKKNNVKGKVPAIPDPNVQGTDVHDVQNDAPGRYSYQDIKKNTGVIKYNLPDDEYETSIR